MSLTKGFIQTQAEAYRDAKVRIKPWAYYAQEVVDQWKEIDRPIELVDSAVSYLSPAHLRVDIKNGRPIKVWSGGTFDPTHPLAEVMRGRCSLAWRTHEYSVRTLVNMSVCHISRALHDYKVHNLLRFSFSPVDELRGALASRSDFSNLAQIAQWTDDVAMGCYYAHYGRWPEVQYPVVVKPDWDGLREYLDGKEGKEGNLITGLFFTKKPGADHSKEEKNVETKS